MIKETKIYYLLIILAAFTTLLKAKNYNLVDAIQGGRNKVETLLKQIKENEYIDNPADYQDKNGNTLLMYAVYFNKFDIAKFLIEKEKADVNIENEGRTALIVALSTNKSKEKIDMRIINLFINNSKTNPNIIRKTGDGPLSLAVENIQDKNDCEKTIKILIEAKSADINKQIFLLAKNNKFKSILSLLDYDVILNRFNPITKLDDNKTLLDHLVLIVPTDSSSSFSARHKASVLVRLLLKKKINFNKWPIDNLVNYIIKKQSYSLISLFFDSKEIKKEYRANMQHNLETLLNYLVHNKNVTNKLFMILAKMEQYSLIHEILSKHPNIKKILNPHALDENNKTFIDYLAQDKGFSFSWDGNNAEDQISHQVKLLEFLEKEKVKILDEKIVKKLFLTGSKKGDKKLVEYTLKKGVDADTKNSKQQNGVMLGAIAQSNEVIDLVFQASKTLKINDEDAEGKTALMLASDTLEDGDNRSKSLFNKLLSPPYNANINYQSKKNGRTLLMEFASKEINPLTIFFDNKNMNSQERFLEEIKDLVEKKGANPDLTDKKGEKAYDLALKAGNQKVAEYLKKVSSKNIQNRDLKQNKNNNKDHQLNQNDIHDIKNEKQKIKQNKKKSKSIDQVNNNDKNKNRNLTLIIIVTLGIGSTIIGGFYWYLTKHSKKT